MLRVTDKPWASRGQVWTLYTPFLAGQTAAHFSPRSPRKQRKEAKNLEENFAQVMSTPQPHSMNKCKTNHDNPRKPERSAG